MSIFIVGIGGSTRANSSTERALRVALEAAEGLGAATELIRAAELDLPMFAPEKPERNAGAKRLVAAVRRADGIIVASPGYHGTISGLIKNALDYTEDLRDDAPPYLEWRAFGCIACGEGWQATVNTLSALRSVAHALRAWPTPLGVPINTTTPMFNAEGLCTDDRLREQLQAVASQVVEFARMRKRS